jgi:hypothetical protein
MKNFFTALKFQTVLVLAFNTLAFSQSGINKENFYEVMSGDNLEQVNKEITVVSKASGPDKEAYLGALTMKKAGLVSGAGKKLKTFKAGHKQLEASISQDKDNAEYRFLRLMIQEHAPGILGYKDEIQSDSDYIRKSFKTLPEPVKQAILDYSKKKSKALSEKDFN